MAAGKNLRSVPWKISDAAWLLVIYWLILPLAIVLIGLVGSYYWHPVAVIVDLWRKQDVTVSFVLDAVVGAAGLGIAWFIVRRRGGSWRDLGWRRFNVAKAIGFVLAVFVVFVLAAAALAWVIQNFIPLYDTNQPQTNDFTASGVITTNWALIALVIMPPIIEETIFRGFILPAAAQKMGFWPGAVVTSLIFGFAHGQVNVGVYTFILGMVFSYLYRKFDSIIPGVMLHTLNNLVSYWAMTSK